METQFEKRLAELINEYSMENGSDTPDWILARYLQCVLDNFNAAVNEREEWYGRSKHIADGLPDEELYPDGTGHPPPHFPSTTSQPDVDSTDNTTDLQS